MKRLPLLGLGLALSMGVSQPACAFLMDEWAPIAAESGDNTSRTALEPGVPWQEGTSGMRFQWIAAACYAMGSHPQVEDRETDEGPVHEVCVDGFWLADREVTQGQWRSIMRTNPAMFRKGDDYPVEQVSWEDVEAFLKRINGLYENRAHFRLPREAEWEFACRNAGERMRYPNGESPNQSGWYAENASGGSHRAATLAANRLGLYDMAGNVWEWTEDAYFSDAYSRHERQNPLVTGRSVYRVIRGGGWGSQAAKLRCANRGFELFSVKRSDLGFRLVVEKAIEKPKPPPEVKNLPF
ncbi:MAG: formylglycine-generating enzyme family protein [Magnetococcales bacterium]|nr:formylglycine-generating enzyme family protein [Magnetococcales bacterium]